MRHIIIILIFTIPTAILSQWQTQISGTTENLRTIYFINSQTGYAGGENGKMLKTVSGGMYWNSLNSGVSQRINSLYFFNADSGIACADGGLIIVTNDGGLNWSNVTSGVTDDLYAVSFKGARGVCSGSSGTLLYSTDSGYNWTVAKNGFLSAYYGAQMVSDSVAYSAGVNAIFQPFTAKTTNGGQSHTFNNFYLNGNEGNLTDICFISENTGFASARVFDGRGAVSKTTDGGASWTTQIFFRQLHSIDFTGANTGYCVGDNYLILKTTDGGTTWGSQSGSQVTALRCVHMTDSVTVYAAGDMGTILKTTNGGVSAVGDQSELIPGRYVLYQNYPNPFNPVTKIKYFISRAGSVSIKIYNTEGREIAVLVNGTVSAGEHSVVFDGNDLAGGIYFYEFIYGSIKEVRKMALVK
ncbi:MAG: T9SS type A sorting domain-containing protein [Bacteroidetes bacterium]|nr:T9SS type A sorting domain-containing protein [Bacteroidota bacterium]